jgi:hypothetical protein
MVCLNTLPDDLHHYMPNPDAKQFLCCGKWICAECGIKFKYHCNHPFSNIMMACPHCRTTPTNKVKTRDNVEELAHKGHSWAQARLAFYYHKDYSSNSSSSSSNNMK